MSAGDATRPWDLRSVDCALAARAPAVMSVSTCWRHQLTRAARPVRHDFVGISAPLTRRTGMPRLAPLAAVEDTSDGTVGASGGRPRP
jgi:hypothetical protein